MDNYLKIYNTFDERERSTASKLKLSSRKQSAS